jgi:uncharacterized protein (DUF885 family)
MTPATTPGEFRSYLTRDWDRWLSELPEFATTVGRTEHDDRWSDDSPEGVDARRRHLEESYQELLRFQDGALPPSDRLNYALYRELLETAREGLEFGLDPVPFRLGFPRHLWMPFNQVDGLHIYAPDILSMQPHERVADYRPLLTRLGRLAPALDQQVELARRGLKDGRTPPQEPLRSVPAQLEALAPIDPAQSALLRPFVEWPASVPEDARPALREEAERIYRKQIRPTLERFRKFVVETYLPACRSTVGARDAPNGAAWYRYLVRWETTTGLSPEEIHETGRREVERLRGVMDRIRTQVGHTGSLADFKGSLRSNPQFTPASVESMIAAYRGLAKRIDPMLAHQFGRLPRLPYGVEPIPEYRAPASPTAYYIGGALATGRAGYFYVNTHDLAARPTWEMEPLTLHEAVPGHHLQIALMEELDDLPEFRRHTGYTAFVEGWGLYAESLGADLGLYTDPYARFGQASMDAWRAARLVVDTGMHALGWSRQQAIDYLLEATGKSRPDIVAEVDRYIVWPGQALAYKIGQLRIREARQRAEKALGDRFDVRAFHDTVLGEGGLPLDQLDRRVDAWIASVS